MAEELKPCPFCGDKADMIENSGRVKNQPKSFHPCCHNRECIMFIGAQWYNSEKEAINAWNRRADNESKTD